MSDNDKIEQVGPVDPTKTTSAINSKGKQLLAATCYFNDKKYSEGSIVCSSGWEYECGSDGTWSSGSQC